MDTPTHAIPFCDWLLLFVNVLFDWSTLARRTPINNCVKTVLIFQELLKINKENKENEICYV